MREILYRGMNHETGKFVYGFYTKLQDGARITHNIIVEDEQAECRFTKFYIHSKETVGQFTGITDKNGAKIFEHDKIYIDGMYLGYILLTDGAFNLIEENNQSGSNIINQARMNRMEIIGNIHEGDK